MTTFTDEEIDFLKNRGNEFARYVYLGTYDERSNLEKESFKEEHKIKEFLLQKYERKRWYVDPEIAQHKMQLDRRQKSATEQGISLTGGSISMPSKPPATFATRSQPVTPAGGELWSPPPQQTPTFGNDLFALCKESIPPPVDPFGKRSVRSNSAAASDLFQNDPFGSNNTSAKVFDPFASNPVSISVPDPFGTKPSTKAAIDPFGSQPVPKNPDPFGGTSLKVHDPFQATKIVIPPPPTIPSSQAPPAPPKTGNGFADFDSAFGDPVDPPHIVKAPETINEDPFPTSAAPKQSFLPEQSKEAEKPPINEAPKADRYAALAALDELFSQKSDPVPVFGSSTAPDPWGNKQPSAAPPPSNPFSPTSGPTSTPATNPWGSPNTSSSPNPFASAARSTTPSETMTQNLQNVTAGLSGISMSNTVANNWPTTNGATSAFGNDFTTPNAQIPQTTAPPPPTFPVSWDSPQTKNVVSFPNESPRAENWASFGQEWPNDTKEPSWPTATSGSTAGFGDVWPQMSNSASTPSIAVGVSPTSNQNSKGAFPQSISAHSELPAQWQNGSTKGPAISNGSTTCANPFASNGTNGLTATRVCSTSNPFL